MNCPGCGGTLTAGVPRCPACGRVVALAVEGALAPDPLSVATGGKPEPLRQIPGLKRRERTWKDEVRERVRRRRSERGASLPLFREEEPPEGNGGPEDAEPAPADARRTPSPAPATSPFATTERMEPPPSYEPEPGPGEGAGTPDEVAEVALTSDRLDVLDDEPPEEWTFQLRTPKVESRPVERPALLLERLQAAAIDLGLLGGLWTIVVYFASRAARVPIDGLLGAWPPLLSYLLFLGFGYAAYFTGTSGQTMGKVVSGLKVVDRAGRAPSVPTALLRAALGASGIVLVAVGLVPMLFDPARRGIHDKLSGTRVIRF